MAAGKAWGWWGDNFYEDILDWWFADVYSKYFQWILILPVQTFVQILIGLTPDATEVADW